MNIKLRTVLAAASLLTLAAFLSVVAFAASDDEAIKVFREAGQSGGFFAKSYGYAIFPSIGKAAVGVGGARGSGRVYEQGKVVGDVKMTQVTVGFALGGQSYSEIIFFEDKRAFDEFTSGNFEFGAQVGAVAITAGASAKASTGGSTAGASGGQHDAATAGGYQKGMAVFTVAKGGVMFEASIGGQKFKYTPKKPAEPPAPTAPQPTATPVPAAPTATPIPAAPTATPVPAAPPAAPEAQSSNWWLWVLLLIVLLVSFFAFRKSSKK